MGTYNRVYNFSAGPSMLPAEVLEKVQKDLLNYEGSGQSVMEMSHRSKEYQKIIDDAGVSEAEKKSAVDAMVKLTENAQMEEDAQMMLEAKGFKNAVVSLSDECCDVIVGKDDVTDEKRAQIEDIIKRKTNIGASNIVISTMD